MCLKLFSIFSFHNKSYPISKVHFRRRPTREREPADWSVLSQIVKAVDIPVFANGDFYDPVDIIETVKMGYRGVLMARPLLLNPSLLRFRDRQDSADKGVICRYDRFLSIRDTILEYLRLCVRYELPYQVYNCFLKIPWSYANIVTLCLAC